MSKEIPSGQYDGPIMQVLKTQVIEENNVFWFRMFKKGTTGLCVFEPVEGDTIIIKSLICLYRKGTQPHPPEGAIDWKECLVSQCPVTE